MSPLPSEVYQSWAEAIERVVKDRTRGGRAVIALELLTQWSLSLIPARHFPITNANFHTLLIMMARRRKILDWI